MTGEHPRLSTSGDGPQAEGPAPRVLVVDDSAPLRATISEMLEEGGCEIIGRAMDGSMALRLVMDEDPDVITLDLEMPRMDGFTFLRILQKTKDTPVIVITSDSRPEAALLALELGARDFVVKPGRTAEMRSMRTQLLSRVRTLAASRGRLPQAWPSAPEVEIPQATSLVAIGCSTGGPRALRDILMRVRPPVKAPILIAQHMPPHFTEAFAARLARATGLDIAEAYDGEIVTPGMIRIAPGGRHLSVESAGSGFRLSVTEPPTTDRFVPSADVLLTSAARAAGPRLLAIVLTGMGKDGMEGARTVRMVGAPLWAESTLTAVVDGMPAAAAQAHGHADRVPIDELAALFARAMEVSGSDR